MEKGNCLTAMTQLKIYSLTNEREYSPKPFIFALNPVDAEQIYRS
jgi:hypothetical protein